MNFSEQIQQPNQRTSEQSPSETHKEVDTSSTIHLNSQKKLACIGPFIFDPTKFRTLMKHPEMEQLYKQNQYLLVLLEKGDKSERILENLPHPWFQAVHQHLGRNFKPSNLSNNTSIKFQFLASFKNLIPMSICHIKFTNLRTLNLSGQNICSIESLAFIDAPKLACLELYGNHIYNMEPLVKANFQELRAITFYRNPIAKMEKFYRIHNKKLTKYEFDHSIKNPNLMEDYRFLFKMQKRNFKELNVKDVGRINLKERGIFNKLNRPGTEIIFHLNMRQVLARRQRVD